MRILLTSPTYPPFNSGLGNAVSQQAACLTKAGHEVIVATGGGTRATEVDMLGIRIERFAVSGANSLLQPIRGDRKTYVDFLRTVNCDIVVMNAWQNWASDLALLHIDEIGGRKFMFSHCISTNVFYSHQPVRSLVRYLAWRPYWWSISKIMRKLDGVIFLADRGSDSRFDDLTLARRIEVPVHVVSNSLSTAAAIALDAPCRGLQERDRLIAIGAYQWQKGFDFVLKAYAKSKACNRIPLHLYGQQRSRYNDLLESLANRLLLKPEFVVFHEGIAGEALIAEYQSAQMVLSGSHTECQPLVLIDASATGTPFIARTTGCIAHMQGGLAVSSWQEMAASIDKILDDTVCWERMSNAARQTAAALYHPDVVSRKLLDVLNGDIDRIRH
ncbi:glycosyltransferase family 4 protein [Propionivibrio dicarboxylicus]|uniref:Glycosyltransferase involved in cell wall bisynthesis n=1 Tax=Propionivibrio dicarboxylicus TaxID=83767 RepID=A0A1G8DZU5_9RHOO|nr:glycosyltransferase family 4 protein [Propionivibrio dicarboxylicus]SDH63148.1 Glycosyltransferase involved in cell wall bisynthesis [Propionivibrio dicarboxylicus]